MRDMSKEFTPSPISQSKIMDRLTTVTDGGKGRIPTIPGSGRDVGHERRQPPKKSHKLRNTLLTTGVLSGIGGGGYIATQGGNESATTNPSVVTTVDVTQPPLTSPETTVITVPTEGYTVLEGGGLHYEVASAPWFGGFDIHLKYDGQTFGFQTETYDGRDPKEFLLNTLLWTFGNQHPEFVKPDGQVDIEAYKVYLEANDWVDSAVFLPDNIAEGPTGFPSPIAKSEAFSLDYKQPFIIGNNDLATIDGFNPEKPNFYKIDTSSGGQAVLGINSNGQLYYSMYFNDGVNIKPADIGDGYVYITTDVLGNVLAVTSRITYPESDPTQQWMVPHKAYYDLVQLNPTGDSPYPVIDLTNYVEIDYANNIFDDALFDSI